MNCPICKNNNFEFIYRFSDTSTLQNKLCDSLENALKEKKMNFRLFGCKDCGFVFNGDFNPENIEYSFDYDNTQENSSYFLKYLEKLAKKLVKKYNLKNKEVVEIGCGKGGFLKLLYQNGAKNIKGFDPSYLNHDLLIDKLVEKNHFDIKNVKNKVDFVVCRHVLEHVPDVLSFVSSAEKCLKNNGTMYFETPSLEWIIKNKAFFDFFYEHCNYFCKKSIVKLFNQSGFGNIFFNHGLKGQYFQIEISRGGKTNYNDYPILDFKKISQFLDKQIKKHNKITAKLDNFAVWGAGAKGVAFLNRLKISKKKCQYVIDINPNKEGKFISVSGQKIVSPEIIKKENFKNIIIMNPVYEREIKQTAKKYNYKGKFILL